MSQPLHGVRVLILEDEFFLADDLARALRQAGAEPVGPVATVEEAEALVETSRLDAAILDLNLRGRMATDFVERLASTRLPCVIVSGYGEDAVSVANVQSLEKPVSAEKVLRTLGAELARAG
jgi:ActR/RegA family two-component response regulator